jgi:hypothetical protein
MTRPATKRNGAATKREMADLNTALDKRLLSYAAIAGAAGVGLLARTAQAEIVFTSANIPIPANSVVSLDLNHDGINDFFFFKSTFGSSGLPTSLSIDPVQPANRILGNKLYASALPAGRTVGPGGKFQQDHGFMVAAGDVYPGPWKSRGQWKGTVDRYLGLMFYFHGEVHYGWARLKVNATTYPVTVTLLGYAYETEANTAILTGATSGSEETSKNNSIDAQPSALSHAPASLGLLAQGSSGLAAWRRNDEARAGK